MTKTNKNSYALDYVNQYLLDCETGMSEIWIGETVEIVDILGTVEEDGRIFVGLEVVTSHFQYGHIIHINFIDKWEFIYKNEMVEIQDILSNLINEQLKIDLGLKDNILNI